MNSEPLETDILDLLLSPDNPPQWVIPDFLPQETMLIYCGDAGVGKSFTWYTISLALASGMSAMSGFIPSGEPKRVLYYDDENSMPDRAKYAKMAYTGLIAQNGGEEPDLQLINDNFMAAHFRLGHPGWADAMRFDIENFQPHIVVVDTAASCFNIENENDNSEAQVVIRQLRSLMRVCEPGASMVIAKHANTPGAVGGKTVRGAKSWKGQSDQMVFHCKSPGKPRGDGLSRTRISPDKKRAYALQSTLYITPHWTDKKRSGIVLEASYKPSKEAAEEEARDEGWDKLGL